MAKLMYPGANRSIRYRDPDAKGDLEQYVNRKEKGDQPQRVNRAGKGDQPQRVNRAGKGDQPQRVNREGKRDRGRITYQGRIGPSKPSNIPVMPAPTGEKTVRKTVTPLKPKPKPARTAEGAAVPVKPKPKPARPATVVRTTVAKRTTPISKPKSKPAPAFKANFKGAAPTAMQARGGARINRGGGLLGLIKRKLGK